MIITPMSANIFTDPFSFKEQQKNQELLPNYGGSVVVDRTQDTLQFSDTALAKLEETSGNNEEQESELTNFLYNKNGEKINAPAAAQASDSSEESSDALDQTIESIRKQIKEVQKKIEAAEVKLAEAMAKMQDNKSGIATQETVSEQSAPPPSATRAASGITQPGAQGEETQVPEAAAAIPEVASVDSSGMDAATKAMINATVAQTQVEAISTELKNLNAQLLSLNNQLADAIKGKMGASSGPAGAAGGTPAGGGV